MHAVTLTHNDLDGLGCLLMLMIKFKPSEYFFSNYHDMEKAVNNIIAYKREHGADTLLIADICFSEHKELLERLAMVFENNVFLVDHHMYPDGFWDDFTFRRVIDKERCAARILFEDLHLDTDIQNESFRKDCAEFIHYVDTWDRWQDESPDFFRAMMYSELLVALKSTDNRCLIDIAKDQIRNRFEIFKHVDDVAKVYMQNYREFLSNNADKIIRDRDIAFVKTWDFHPILNQDLYKNGIGIVVSVWNGIFKVRINSHKGYSEEKINALRRHLTGADKFCHLHAFTYATNLRTGAEYDAEFKKIVDFWYSET